MREIKFRAWDNIDKKMYQHASKWFNWEMNCHKNDIHNWEWINIGCWRDDWEVDYSYDLIQYTWLKDKNGKEIYEGDYTSSGFMICFIDWMFIPYYDWGNQERYEDVWCDWWSECEIIGNQYENPNLPEEYDR